MAQTGIALVTGASGFIGSAVVRALLARGWPVHALVRPTSSRLNLDGLAVDIRNGSLDDEASLVSALDGCEFLFHAAADYRLWVPDPEAMYAANILGTRRLMEAALAARLRRIVYTSSVATLGFAPDGRSGAGIGMNAQHLCLPEAPPQPERNPSADLAPVNPDAARPRLTAAAGLTGALPAERWQPSAATVRSRRSGGLPRLQAASRTPCGSNAQGPKNVPPSSK